jgi:transposase
MVPESVLKSVMTAALHQGTLISFRRVRNSARLGRLAGTNPIPRETMSRKRKSNQKSNPKTAASLLSCLNLNAAGIDIGATEIYIAVPGDRDPQPVRCFPTFTEDLHAAAAWLKACHIETVAMESTGVYWIPLFQILEARGFKVFLVNAHHVKNVPGRKSDVSACQWLQYLHSVGLLRGSFRPQQAVCSVRSILRHRDSLVQMASSHVQHMQKALDQMNLQLHHVISDITGMTGIAILEAILAGERNPHTLAALRDRRIKASADTIAKSLVGDYRREHLFTLRQSLAAFRHYQQLIAACDREIAQSLEQFESKLDPPVDPPPASPSPSNDGSKPKASEPSFDLQTHLHRIFGVDLTQVPGINVLTAQTLLAEIGPDLSRFPSGPEFASWLGLCSDNRVSGGKVLSVKTRKVKNRAATALRMAALSVHRSQSFLGHFYRRMRAKLGAPKAITATAHKLARILYHMVTTGHAYDETICAQNEVQNRKRMEARLRKQARELGLQLVAL